MTTDYNRKINLANYKSNHLALIRLDQEIGRQHATGKSAAEIADSLKIPQEHTDAVFIRSGWAKPAQSKPHRIAPQAIERDNTAVFAADMIRGGYDEGDVAAHIKLPVSEMRKRIAAAGR